LAGEGGWEDRSVATIRESGNLVIGGLRSTFDILGA
jgi:hypothetical protein